MSLSVPLLNPVTVVPGQQQQQLVYKMIRGNETFVIIGRSASIEAIETEVDS